MLKGSMEFGLPVNKKADITEESTQESKSLLVHAPRDIIENILFRHPVKFLCRFKTVSRTCNSSISNLKFHTQSVFSIFKSEKGWFFHSVTDEGASTGKFPVPWGNSDTYSVYASNSCNGMVLIGVGTCFYLFNPSTHYFVKVLTLNYVLDRYKHNYNMFIGLYYDEAIADYKAVVLVQYYVPKTVSILVEASLKGKRWNHLNHTFKTNHHIIVGPMVNGRIHWLNENKIFRFDPVLKVFEELPSFQPQQNHIEYSRTKIAGIGILEECLCVSRINYINKTVEILAMKEYGVSESWTPIFSFLDEKFFSDFDCNPLLLTRAGELFVSIYDQLWMPNLGKNLSDVHRFPNEGLSTCLVSFVQNLDTPTGYYWNQTEHENFGNTEDFTSVQKFCKDIDLIMSNW